MTASLHSNFCHFTHRIWVAATNRFDYSGISDSERNQITYLRGIPEAQKTLSAHSLPAEVESRLSFPKQESPFQMFRPVRCFLRVLGLICAVPGAHWRRYLSQSGCLFSQIRAQWGSHALSHTLKSLPPKRAVSLKNVFPMANQAGKSPLLLWQIPTEECEWSGPAAASLRVSRRGRALWRGVEQNVDEGTFKGVRKKPSKYRSSSACCSEVVAQRSQAGFICLWMDWKATGGELRLSLLATATWTPSSPLKNNKHNKREEKDWKSEWENQRKKGFGKGQSGPLLKQTWKSQFLRKNTLPLKLGVKEVKHIQLSEKTNEPFIYPLACLLMLL